MLLASPETDVSRLGFWSAAVAAAASAAFCVATVLIMLKVLAPPWDVYGSLIPSIVLAPAFLVMMVCIAFVVNEEKRIWAWLAVAFAVVYVPLVSMSYVVEMLVVEPRVMRGELQAVSLLTLTSTTSVFNAVDGLGYCFMSLATLFAAPAFGADRVERWVRRLFVVNGVLLVPTVLTYFVSRNFIWFVFPWAVTIPGSGLLLAILFRRSLRAAAEARRAAPWRVAPSEG